MLHLRTLAALAGLAVLAGCASTSPLPSIAGGSSAAGYQLAAAPGASGSGLFGRSDVSGTFVGQKIAQLRGDLRALEGQIGQRAGELQQARSVIVQNAQDYYTRVASINARLQGGTTPGNPRLVQEWNQAQAQLSRIDGSVAQLTELSNRVATDAAMTNYLLDSIRSAYEIPGAVEEDHHQLAALQDDVNRSKVQIDRLHAEINQEVSRQTGYIAGERQDLSMLAMAIKQGELHSGRGGGAMPAAYATASVSDRPLVIIRFDQPNVAYEQPLYTAVSQALDRRPEATFDVVAVPGGSGMATSARRHAERVMRTFTDMGMPRDRVRLTSGSGSAGVDEVHVYVR